MVNDKTILNLYKDIRTIQNLLHTITNENFLKKDKNNIKNVLTMDKVRIIIKLTDYYKTDYYKKIIQILTEDK